MKCVLRSLDSVYHSALRFVTKADEYSTHHGLIDLLPSYLSIISLVQNNRYNLRSKDSILFKTPAVQSEFGKIAFRYNAPSTWNALQKQMKLGAFTSLKKYILKRP